MTSAEIRNSFLDFFRGKQHTIVPSSSLLPDSPNLLFTNAGMNQFVPIFLGQRNVPIPPARRRHSKVHPRRRQAQRSRRRRPRHLSPHVLRDARQLVVSATISKRKPSSGRGNCSSNVWNFPPSRLYATVYQPGPGDPSEFDQEAYDFWAETFAKADSIPHVHIVNGKKKDNFWMMGETGPCGPCSESTWILRRPVTPRGALGQQGDRRVHRDLESCLHPVQREPRRQLSPLPAKHVDTGMGFERVTSIIQGTKNFTDFANAKISNYDTDIFRPIFDELENLSGKKYGSTLPDSAQAPLLETRQTSHRRRLSRYRRSHPDPEFRHRRRHSSPATPIGTMSCAASCAAPFATAAPSGFQEPFFYKLVAVSRPDDGRCFSRNPRETDSMSRTCSGGKKRRFNKTLDRGTDDFNLAVRMLLPQTD